MSFQTRLLWSQSCLEYLVNCRGGRWWWGLNPRGWPQPPPQTTACVLQRESITQHKPGHVKPGQANVLALLKKWPEMTDRLKYQNRMCQCLISFCESGNPPQESEDIGLCWMLNTSGFQPCDSLSLQGLWSEEVTDQWACLTYPRPQKLHSRTIYWKPRDGYGERLQDCKDCPLNLQNMDGSRKHRL